MPRPGEDRSDVGGAAQFQYGPVPPSASSRFPLRADVLAGIGLEQLGERGDLWGGCGTGAAERLGGDFTDARIAVSERLAQEFDRTGIGPVGKAG